jgi:hypothetical protein
MKNQALIFVILLVISFMNSCSNSSDYQPKAEIIPIKESLNVEIFDFERNKTDSVLLISWMYNAFIINSIEQLKHPFETLDLEVPEALMLYDFEKNTFILRFHVGMGRSMKGIKHKLFRNIETGQFTYSMSLIYDSTGEFIPSELYFFFSGILVDKISDESLINVVMSATNE